MVSGALANKPSNGGNAWSRLSWILGFKQLGFDVVFVEQLDSEACVDMDGARVPFEASANLDYFRATVREFGLSECSSLIYQEGKSVYGLSLARLAALARESCLLFNLSGHLTQPEVIDPAPCRVYYDDDPGYTQFWHASGEAASRLKGHHFHFTLGKNIGTPGCSIPAAGIDWRHTRPPVTLQDWPVVEPTVFDRFTTVASWRGAYAPASFAGKTYGLKVHEFRKFLAMPKRTYHPFEIALQIHPGDHRDLAALQSAAWRIVDPLKVAHSPEAFRRYVQTSGAEFSVAQGVYVETHSGWFSDRTVRYLASGRPVLIQDTGLSAHYPIGNGLLTFRGVEEAVEGAQRIVQDYAIHCRAARRVAETCFDASIVIRELLDQVGVELP